MFKMKKLNLNLRAFADLGVEIPDTPLDLSGALRESGINYPYVIVTMGRTGSTWLAAALGQIPEMNAPNEYFSQEAIKYYGDFSQPQSFDKYFRSVLTKHGRNGCFGFKINPRRLAWLGDAIDMKATFPMSNCAWIEMKRLNLVKQAFSYARAKTSGHWHNFEGRPQDSGDNPPVSDQLVWQHILEILQEERIFADFCKINSIKPMLTYYEEIYDAKEQLLIRITSYIRSGFDVRPRLEKVRDRVTKLKTADLDEEASFIFRYADEINLIMSERDTIPLNQVEAFVSRAA
ncbi:Stf0 family sulfotransferase [Rhodobacter capsulatus]|uniref:LPS sulfotransferase NodH n=1 Tax=Rhodobacter capsulatus TaxID=1061 RepID=A0A1G7QDB0_RHOCA|nr:Stf0 family sulfotransferase [Rhodobacter capsulatus]WER09562.1 Stf0 family sulfotransferase [Rhodobacter capsulatus]SDF96492.1 LPS sulfotransferase NodH [Rhodobacter capsulatus]